MGPISLCFVRACRQLIHVFALQSTASVKKRIFPATGKGVGFHHIVLETQDEEIENTVWGILSAKKAKK